MFSNINPLLLVMLIVGTASDIAVMIIGTLIIIGKVRQVKVLGIGFVVSSVFALISHLCTMAFYLSSEPVSTALSWESSAAGIVASVAGSICVCLYIHKNYGCKWVYFPVLAQPIVSTIARLAFEYVLRDVSSTMQYVFSMGLSSNATSLVTGSVEAVILIVLFYKNSDKEKLIPHAWIIRLVEYCLFLIIPIASIIFYSVCLKGELQGGDTGFHMYHDSYGNLVLLMYIITMLGSLLAFLMPVYILVRIKRSETEE